MPLLDHFHAPLDERYPWESFHSGWATRIADQLSERVPAEFMVAEQTHSGNHLEIDVATFEDSTALRQTEPVSQAVALASTWAPSYLPELATLRRFADRISWLFDTPKDYHQASCRLSAIVRDRAFGAVPELVQAMEQLSPEKFPKIMAYLKNPVSRRVRTNNHVERTNRMIRFLEKVRYKWRRRKTLVRFVALRLDYLWSHWIAVSARKAKSPQILRRPKPQASTRQEPRRAARECGGVQREVSAFAIKCASYLHQGVSLIIIDIITSRRANLHNEILALLPSARVRDARTGGPLRRRLPAGPAPGVRRDRDLARHFLSRRSTAPAPLAPHRRPVCTRRFRGELSGGLPAATAGMSSARMFPLSVPAKIDDAQCKLASVYPKIKL